MSVLLLTLALVFGDNEGTQIEKGYLWLELEDSLRHGATNVLHLICTMLGFDRAILGFSNDVKPLNEGDYNTSD